MVREVTGRRKQDLTRSLENKGSRTSGKRATGVPGLDFLIHALRGREWRAEGAPGPDISKALRLPTYSTSFSIRICLWNYVACNKSFCSQGLSCLI